MARPQIGQVMQSSTRKTAGSVHAKQLHGTLVAAQIALTLLLLTAAGAAIESFVHLLRIPLGYDPHNVIAASISVQDNTYTTWQARVNYFEQLRASAAALPDVVSAAISNNGIPPDSGWEQQVELLGKPAASPEAQTARANLVGPDYFQTLHTPLLEGRVWSASEVSRGAAMVLVSETFAKRYVPNGDAVGQFIKLPEFANLPPGIEMAPGADGWLQVIGVVGDARNDGLDRPVRPAIFAPYSLVMFPGTQIFVRSRVAPDSILQGIRKQLAAVNPDQQDRDARKVDTG